MGAEKGNYGSLGRIRLAKGGRGRMSWPEGEKNRRAPAAEPQPCRERRCRKEQSGTGALGVIQGSQQLQGTLEPAQEEEFAFLHVQVLRARAWKLGILGNIWQCGQGFPDLPKA